MIKNLKLQSCGTWTWRKEGVLGCYYTNKNGEGIFFQRDDNGSTSQEVGTSQFNIAGYSVSGARKKIGKICG